MKAEAMTMQGTPYDQICRMLDTTTRRRAGFDDASKLSVPETEEEMLKIILNERIGQRPSDVESETGKQPIRILFAHFEK